MLAFDDVHITRPGGVSIRADLAVAPQARLGVIGPSGVGKSTLMEAIIGLIAVQSGRMCWQGTRFDHCPPHARPVAMMGQNGNLFSHLPVARSLELTLAPDRRVTAEDRAHVAEALAEMGLAGKGDRLPGALSGGERVRAGLARVLLANRPVLILDEPFGAVGPALKADMHQIVAKAVTARRMTLILVSHEMADIRALCPEVAVMEQGLLHPPQPTEPLLADPPPYLARYLQPAQDAGASSWPVSENGKA